MADDKAKHSSEFRGYLKEVNRIRTKSRWFVLEGPILTKFHSKDSSEPTWKTVISGATIKENEKKNEIRIVGERKIDLIAMDRGDFAAWSVALKRAVELKPPAGYSRGLYRTESMDSVLFEAIIGDLSEGMDFGVDDEDLDKLEKIRPGKRQLVAQLGKDFEATGSELKRTIDEVKVTRKEEKEQLRDSYKKHTDSARALWLNCAHYIGILEAERDAYKKLYQDKLTELSGLENAVSSMAKENLNMERRQTMQLLQERRALKQRVQNQRSALNGNESDDDDDDDDIFFDALERGTSSQDLARTSSTVSLSGKPGEVIHRRTRLPAFQQKEKASVWNVLKNNLGKSLSRIALPIVFNEPLSVLQRCCEDLEYSHLLDTAAKLPDSAERLAYAAAFHLSAYSTTMHRTSKPSNPLLGETYECIRPERGDGFRYISEQVSHHPPVSAVWAQGNAGWVYEMTVDVESAFKGTSLEVYPKGYSNLSFPAYGDRISYLKITTCVHNIVVGKMWIDNYGQSKLVNHRTQEVCIVDVEPYDWFKGSLGNLSGKVMDSEGKVRYLIKGNWNDSITIQKASSNEPPKLIWKKYPPPANHKEQYHFTNFTITLNELDNTKDRLPPTDCRFRPDQRLYEEGKVDEAQKEKDRVEEKQRYARRLLEAQGEEFQARWFKKRFDQVLDQDFWFFDNEYWTAREKRDWSRCPDIY